MEEILYIAKKGKELPKVNSVLKIKDIFDNNKVNSFKVKQILRLEWNDDNDLIINLKGSYV